MKLPKLSAPKGPKPHTAHAGPSKPNLRMRKIKLAGRSAFPTQKTAFGPPDPMLGAPDASLSGGGAIGPPVPGAAGPGETDA